MDKLSALLKAHKNQILKKWEDRVRLEVPAALFQTHVALIDHLPQVLDTMIEALETEGPIKILEDKEKEMAKEHGQERASLPEYSLEQVIHEYDILQEIIFQLLDPEEKLSIRDAKRLWMSVFVATKNSAIQYSLSSQAELSNEQSLREAFISTLSHDLRNPLSSAKLSAQLILRFPSQHDRHLKMATKIVESMERSDKMISNLLDANRLKVGQKLMLEHSECDLVVLAQEVCDEINLIYGNRVILKTNRKVMSANLDCNAIRRVLENLGSNAVKYGASEGKVTFSLEDLEKEIHMSVHNEGLEIPKDDMKNLFKLYHRTQSAQDKNIKGWGLGLTLVKGLVEAHNGSISVESTNLGGTIFKIRLPKV